MDCFPPTIHCVSHVFQYWLEAEVLHTKSEEPTWVLVLVEQVVLVALVVLPCAPLKALVVY